MSLFATTQGFPTSTPKSLMLNLKAIDNQEGPVLEPLELVKVSKGHKKNLKNSQNHLEIPGLE